MKVIHYFLTFIKQKNNLVKSFEKIHVVVAIFLDLVEQNQLRFEIGRKGRKQSCILLQVSQRLILK